MIHGKIGYRIVRSALGAVGVVWHYHQTRAVVIEIVLPVPHLKQHIQRRYAHLQYGGAPNIDALCGKLSDYCAGARVRFSIDDVDMSRLGPFQKKVLLCERQIPHGWVSTYGRLAKKIGSPGAARAVGTALARNPFPLVIPCHRTVRANGALGGFRGGAQMKRVLLEREGIQFQRPDRIVMNRVW
jgi:methylated-DNA-[protein]-cysteine S-methyltransferase